jgi:hypothetical protein
MSATATKPAQPDEELKCPRCGAHLAPRQDWCLECGAAATTRVLPPPGWGLPTVIVGFAVLLAAAAFATTVTVLSRDSNRSVKRQPAANTPAQPSAPTTSTPTTSTPKQSSPPPVTGATPAVTKPPTVAPAGKNPIAPWPKNKTGWTVIVRQVRNRSQAVTRAKLLSKQGVETGLLRSADFSGLDQGFWMVYSGRYASQSKAQAAAAKLKKKAPTNYVAFVPRPRR